MNSDPTSPEQSPASLEAKPGFITGTAVVRDKYGNIKGEITFGGPATAREISDMQDSFPNSQR